MSKPLRRPKVAAQHVLDHLQVRLSEAHEKDAWNQLVVAHHYLKSADLVGTQLRYVAEYERHWLVLLGWSAPAFHLQARAQWLRWSQPQLRAGRHFLARNSRLVVLADRHQFPNLASRLSAVPGTGRRLGPLPPPALRRLARGLRPSHRRRGEFCRSSTLPRHRAAVLSMNRVPVAASRQSATIWEHT